MVRFVKSSCARIALVAALSVVPSAASPHPHIFIDAGLRLIFEEGVVTFVEVTWVYDELYTLILLEDYGLDQDFDFELTQDEVDQTIGFDLNWNSGFEGGLTLRRGGSNPFAWRAGAGLYGAGSAGPNGHDAPARGSGHRHRPLERNRV